MRAHGSQNVKLRRSKQRTETMEAYIIALGADIIMWGSDGWKNRVRCSVQFIAGVAAGYCLFS